MEDILKNLLARMKLSKMDFIRGLGIIEDRFVLSFKLEDEQIDFEIETNFRVRNKNEILLSFNDLYLDNNRKEIGIRKYRSQTTIEKTYLHEQIEKLNGILKNIKPSSIVTKSYGDVYILFRQKGIVLEILNDTHLENACLYRLLYKKNENICSYECNIKNNQLVTNQINI